MPRRIGLTVTDLKDENETLTNDLLHAEGQQALLDATEVVGDVPETIESSEANIMVKLKAVVKLMPAWQVGPLIRSTFTRAQSMEMRGPSGSVYIIRIPLDFAAAVMQEEDMRLQDGDIADEVRVLARSSFFEHNGRYPTTVELTNYIMAADVSWQ